jgi:hypothetical protein
MAKNNLKLKQYSSNKAISIQFLLNHKVLITNKEKLLNNILNNSICTNKINILKRYNNKEIKYNTLQYLLIQNKLNSRKDFNTIKKNITQLSIEYSIESGLYSF